MNRIQLLDVQFDHHKSVQSRFSNLFDFRQQHRRPSHRFFIPLHYEKKYGYPLLIWLHGPTGQEAEINQVMPHISLRNYVGVSPRGIVKDTVCTSSGDPTYTWNQDPQAIEDAAEDVVQCISMAQSRFNIAPDRVFLVGNDVGGTMALRLALSFPEHFAGVASIGGSLPDSNTPLAGVQRARSLPVMIAHGRDSDVYSTDHVCRDLRLLHAAGMSVTLRQYPCEQEVTTQMLSDLDVWVMEQISGTVCETTDMGEITHLRIQDFN